MKRTLRETSHHALTLILISVVCLGMAGCSGRKASNKEEQSAVTDKDKGPAAETKPSTGSQAVSAAPGKTDNPNPNSGAMGGGGIPNQVGSPAPHPAPHQAAPRIVSGNTPPQTDSVAAVSKRASEDFTEVGVFFGTDRNRQSASMQSPPSRIGLLSTAGLFAIAVGLLVFNRMRSGFSVGTVAAMSLAFLLLYPMFFSPRTGPSYGTQRGTFVRGYATVTVPASHKKGTVERPSILRLEFEEDQDKHIVVANAEELDADEFYQRLGSQVADSEGQDLLVFIHGYNVDFDSAIRRTAQIATDLSFQGVPVCYSWPSQGSLLGYTVDENNVTWTVPHLRDFLLELAERSDAKSISIIAHSMGNRAMTASLSEIDRDSTDNTTPLFDQVVLAAPDIDADHFRNELAPRLTQVARHVTLYASSDDRALVASKRLHGGYARAGESGDNLVVIRGIETIDVSGIDLSLLGHSYYGTCQSILEDLLGVVRKRLPAKERQGLVPKRMNGTPYWLIPTPKVADSSNSEIR